MGFGSTIVDVLKRLAGMTPEPPVVTLDGDLEGVLGGAESGQREPGPGDPGDAGEAGDLGGVAPGGEDPGELAEVDVRDEWDDMQAFVARCEAEAIELVGIDLGDPATFWRVYYAIEGRGGEATTEAERAQRAVAGGYADLRHWEWVSQYCQIKWSELIDEPESREIRPRPDFVAAGERLRRGDP